MSHDGLGRAGCKNPATCELHGTPEQIKILKLSHALAQILGFAERNNERAKTSLRTSMDAYIADCSDTNEIEERIQRARQHEAERIFNVIQNQIAKANR